MGTPIINQPQVAIMAVGAIRKKPAVIETPYGDTLGIRHMMYSHAYEPSCGRRYPVDHLYDVFRLLRAI